jgi:hypothetical protein
LRHGKPAEYNEKGKEFIMFSGHVRLWQTANGRNAMKSRTIHLPILCVVPGMTLAESLLDRQGRILFAAGTILDAVMLDRLNKRGIESLAALITDTRDAGTINQEVLAAESKVLLLFRGPGSEARQALQVAILDYRKTGAQ